MFPQANDDFTCGNPHCSGLLTGYLIQIGLDSLTMFRYGGCHVSVTLDESTSVMRDLSSWSGHFRDDNFGNVMEHLNDSTGMTILILS